MKKISLDSNIPLYRSVYSSAQIRAIELDYATKSDEGTYPLMEAAGYSAYQRLKDYWPLAPRLLILTGKGNNGGDGYVIARLAAAEGKSVTLCNFCPEDKLKGDALLAFQKLPPKGIIKKSWLQIDLDEFDLVIDAMLGTGIQGVVREPFAEVIDQVNRKSTPVLAVDIPSGLNADTGRVTNCAIRADVTTTFIGYKPGLFTGDALEHCGKISLLDLSVPESCYLKQTPFADLQDWLSLKNKFKPRKRTAHKGDYGRCHIIGGSEGMAGAAILAATAAARCGSGLTAASLQNDAASLLTRCPEVMTKNVSRSQIEEQVPVLQKANALVVGPGLGSAKWSKSWMALLTANECFRQKNKIWDADALNWLAENPDFDDRRILTPHPGEAARLLNSTTQLVSQDRFASAADIVQKYGGVCVLKGAGTIVARANQTFVICPVGNSGMASGGMGDVLSGIIGALLSQGFSLFDAACLGVCIHGEAAERVAGDKQLYRGMLASDLLGYLPELINP